MRIGGFGLLINHRTFKYKSTGMDAAPAQPVFSRIQIIIQQQSQYKK